MSHRSKLTLRKIPEYEKELHVIENPLSSTSDKSIESPLLSTYDYQAPLTSDSLSLNSKWLVVRNNLHKIRSWSAVTHASTCDQGVRDWYLFFQIRRELKCAEEQIRAIQFRSDFQPVRHFELPIDDKRVRRYNVSHVRPTDGLYYAGLGSDPIALQYLLYYFSKECAVPRDSMFYSFLYDVNSVLHTNRQRIHRVVVFQKLAFVATFVTFAIILIMFFSLILSVLTTTSKLRQMYL